MEEKDLFKKINDESENNTPDVYDKILFAAHAQGLLDNGDEEAYSDGETVALGGVNKRAVAITTLAALAAVSLAIALPVALSGKYDGGENKIVAELDLGEDYAVGAVATSKLAESFLDEEVSGEAKSSHRAVKAASLAVNPDEAGIERYISQFDNYFYACNSFFGEKPAEVETVENQNAKYNNSIIISGKFSNGDVAHYSMYYTEARIIGDTTVTGDEVKYYLEGVLYLNGKNYSMYGERVYSDATKEQEKSLSIKAYPEGKSENDCVEMSVEYGAGGSVKKYAFTVVKGDEKVSESVLTFPDGSGDGSAYNIEFSGDDGERGGKFTVNHPKEGWESLVVGYEIGNLTSEFRVKATASKIERVLAPDGLMYDDLGDGTCAITGYDKRKVMPAELILPNEFEGKKVVKIDGSAFDGCLTIRKVVIPEGITLINEFAFYRCENITEIVLPKTLTQIGTCAFYQTKITELNLPENLVTLNRQAFGQCNKLEKVVIPEGVETLGDLLFTSCASLKAVSIPVSVNSIGNGVISGTAIESITVDGANPYYYVEGGCLMEKATKTVLGGSVGFVIPNDAKIIGRQAFNYCKHITNLTLPASVTEIGNMAFDECSINSITMPGVEIINSYAFISSDLEAVEFSENLATIDNGAFSQCKRLTALNFPASVTSVDDAAFYFCNALESITVSEGNPYYYSAGNCLIKNSGSELVLGCINSVIPNDGSVKSIGAHAFSGQGITEITLPEGLLSIGNYAFSYCENLTDIVIPDSVTVIGAYAFYKCYKLESIGLPGSLQVISNNAFQHCYSLKHVTIPKTVDDLRDEIFSDCRSLTEIVFSNGVSNIAGRICVDCISLEKVILSSSVTAIDAQAFYGCLGLILIEFDGTMEQWNKIGKGEGWDWDTGNYTVICTNGKLDKDGNVIN